MTAYDTQPMSRNPPEAGLFGLTTTKAQASSVILGVAVDATCSYLPGCALTPSCITAPSHQLDLEDPCFGKTYRHGLHLINKIEPICLANQKAKQAVHQYRNCNNKTSTTALQCIDKANAYCKDIHAYVYEQACGLLAQGKHLSVLGGDHSAPYGLIKALAEHYGDFGILHIDAHFDLRKAYEGLTWSHASIMHNVLHDIHQIQSLVSVGVRDYSHEEKIKAEQDTRITVYSDRDLFYKKADAVSFKTIADNIIAQLPKQVYVSFDIDGLQPVYAPHTGTPVPGGLDYQEAVYLIEQLALSKRHIIGFDLCEVSPGINNNAIATTQGEWDLNVAARLLYKLCGAQLYTSL